jgi:hypothetical protein
VGAELRCGDRWMSADPETPHNILWGRGQMLPDVDENLVWHRIPNFGDPLASAERPSGGHRKPTGPDHRPMEFVFVVPRRPSSPPSTRTACRRSRRPRGPTPTRARSRSVSSSPRSPEHGFFVERARAETSPQWKQVIPYSLVECDGRILVVRRLRKGGESRLHEKHSIGIGGHINPETSPRDASAALAIRPEAIASKELAIRSTRELGAKSPRSSQ